MQPNQVVDRRVLGLSFELVWHAPEVGAPVRFLVAFAHYTGSPRYYGALPDGHDAKIGVAAVAEMATVPEAVIQRIFRTSFVATLALIAWALHPVGDGNGRYETWASRCWSPRHHSVRAFAAHADWLLGNTRYIVDRAEMGSAMTAS
jgi:hypothetical protein